MGGGKGTRIGYDKKKLELGGVSVLDTLIARLKALFSEVLLSSNDPLPRACIPVLPDTLGAGPMAGIYQGLLHCASEYLYVVACDMPFINADYITYMRELLAQQAPDVCIAQKADGELELFNSFYKSTCLVAMESALSSGIYQIRRIFPVLRVHITDSDTLARFDAQKMFFNINYQEDLKAAEHQ